MSDKPKRKRLTDADLRAEPEYQELCALLKKQSPEQQARLEDYLSHECEPSQQTDHGMNDLTALDERILTLKRVGASFAEIAVTLEAEGYRNERGKPFNRDAVSKRYYRATERLSSQPAQPCETLEPEPVSCEPCELCDDSPIDPGVLTWSVLRDLIRQEIRSVMSANLAKRAKLPPPTPRKLGETGRRKLAGQRVTLPGMRVDRVLFDLFDRERRGVGISASELMQRILWAHFGEPRLSFQRDEG